MWPTLVDGGLPIHTYGALLLAGFVAAIAVIFARVRTIGVHPDRLILLTIATAIGGLLGARLFEAFTTSLWTTLAHPTTLFTSFDGLTWYGGLIGGAATGLAVATWQGLPTWKLADVMIPAMLLGNGIGRVGCLFAGCCHGAPVALSGSARPLLAEGAVHGQVWLDSLFPFVALEFGRGSVARLQDAPLYPTQLWAAVGLVVLAVVLMGLWRYRRFDGMILGLGLVTEPLLRFAIEAFRADHRGTLFTVPASDALARWLPGMVTAGAELGDTSRIGLTTSQAIAVALVVTGVVVLITRRNAGVAPEQALAPEQ